MERQENGDKIKINEAANHACHRGRNDGRAGVDDVGPGMGAVLRRRRGAAGGHFGDARHRQARRKSRKIAP